MMGAISLSNDVRERNLERSEQKKKAYMTCQLSFVVAPRFTPALFVPEISLTLSAPASRSDTFTSISLSPCPEFPIRNQSPYHSAQSTSLTFTFHLLLLELKLPKMSLYVKLGFIAPPSYILQHCISWPFFFRYRSTSDIVC